MMSRPRCRSALFGFGLVALVPVVAGCERPVREDRSINWSSGGASLGFQHGSEGVFLADKDGRNLTKIAQPDPDVIATSTPLWSPTGKRVIFTTARSPNGRPPMTLPFVGPPDPAGRIHFQQDVRYTCWLYEHADGDPPAKPVPLTEAAVDHAGYVAANLAVRWHPSLERIVFIGRVAEHRHGLFEFDLATGQSRQVCPQTAEALVFDWTPDGSHLACVLGGSQRTDTDGIWIGQAAGGDWWHVPHSGELAPGELDSPLEGLRATRPAWTADGSRFAFASYLPGPTAQQAGRHFLRHATLATQSVEEWASGDRPYRDLRWDPAGRRLGVVCGDDGGTLHLAEPGRRLSPAINRAPVRRFAGWSADGERLAYVVPDELPLAGGTDWALLLAPEATARDRVFVAAGDGTEPGRPVFSGMRVTFPQWSPSEDKLSLWVTFTPAYRSVASELLGWGLHPGDPAAVFDVKTGRLGWMPVHAEEKVQVGHYYLLKRDYAEAWRWYGEAEKELPPPAPVAVEDFMGYLRALQGPRDFSIFESYCLSKLGRADEARAKLDQFRRVFLPELVGPAAGRALVAATPENRLQELLGPGQFLGALVQDLYVAEVFLSLDAAPDAETFFRQALDQAETDAARLSRAIVLGQILLLERKHREFAELTTETVAPLLTKNLTRSPRGEPRDFLDPASIVGAVGELAVLPIGAADFLSQLPDGEMRELKARWQTLLANTNGSDRPFYGLVARGIERSLATRPEVGIAAKAEPPKDDEAVQRIAALRRQMRDLMRQR
jgi:tetratricopeptide (TPR) repeat protein